MPLVEKGIQQTANLGAACRALNARWAACLGSVRRPDRAICQAIFLPPSPLPRIKTRPVPVETLSFLRVRLSHGPEANARCVVTSLQLIWSMCFVNLHRRGVASELRGLSTKPGTLPEMQAALRRAPSPGLRGLVQ